ncbi:hypothetical protein IscW_ISCW003486 [Ixodes scapularis]|uniref:Uncharacterized protein n=1 Tax=Ixodes scapularis TaxID=6945 RepID=B7PIR3_IXOSC|nr:hypothetical protein IscW_ISCW003486 [Ixodes scapularis]|eukprot:XP_002405893.1 hypothetical protein IscW_ISCW003486 [Ixodes scapularis]
MGAAAVAEKMRFLRSQGGPKGVRLLVGLRSLDVENVYLGLWKGNGSALVAHANLVYEWLRDADLDGLALLNLAVGRDNVDVYAGFLKG